MSFFEKHKDSLEKAIQATKERTFYAHHPEHPGAYKAESAEKGKADFENQLGNTFTQLLQTGNTATAGDEVSPYTSKALAISYPTIPHQHLNCQRQSSPRTMAKNHPQRACRHSHRNLRKG
jgi:hypothetical protein